MSGAACIGISSAVFAPAWGTVFFSKFEVRLTVYSNGNSIIGYQRRS